MEPGEYSTVTLPSTCPFCGSPVSLTATGVAGATPQCSSCRANLPVVSTGTQRPVASAPLHDVDMRSPDIDVTTHPVWKISRPWDAIKGWVGLLFIVVIFSVLWSNDAKTMVYDFAGAAALPFIYFALAHILNRTTLSSEGSDLVVRHMPVPWPGCRLRVAEIDAFKIMQRTWVERVRGHPDELKTAWDVKAVMRDGRTSLLLSDFKSIRSANHAGALLAGHFERPFETPFPDVDPSQPPTLVHRRTPTPPCKR
jgi:hypothetical protein